MMQPEASGSTVVHNIGAGVFRTIRPACGPVTSTRSSAAQSAA